MVKWTQAVKDNTFQQYDWGKAENRKRYGSDTPPRYDLSKFSVPTAVFSGMLCLLLRVVTGARLNDIVFDLNVNQHVGGYDVLADPADVLRLMSELPQTTVVFQNNQEKYVSDDCTVLALPALIRIGPCSVVCLVQL